VAYGYTQIFPESAIIKYIGGMMIWVDVWSSY